MANTTAQEVIDFFESSFGDRHVLPDSLEQIWLRKAISRYTLEIDPLNYDDKLMQFDTKLDDYIIFTLAEFMKQLYLERQYDIVNKRVAITGKDLTLDGGSMQKVHTKNELDYTKSESSKLVESQKPTAYT